MDVHVNDDVIVRIEHVRPDQDSADINEGCFLLKNMTFREDEYRNRVQYFSDCVKFLWDRSKSHGHVSMLCSSFYLCGCERSLLDLWDVYLEFSREFDEFENAVRYLDSETRPSYGRIDVVTEAYKRKEHEMTERFKTALICLAARAG